LTVPNANTDETRPANVSRVEVYALNGPSPLSGAAVLAQGTRVASVAVKAPRDPNATFDPSDPEQFETDVAPPEGEGLDQGTVARVQEELAAAPPASTASDAASVRSYVGVGVTARGRRGPSSQVVAVPLAPSPPPPSKPEVTYTEKEITVKWPALPSPESSTTTLAYNVYEGEEGTSGAQLTKPPIAEAVFVDQRMTWGATRCYSVRSVGTIDDLSVESEATSPTCVTLTDTFPPAPPKGLRAVATEGAINLIWDANTEADLAGYILFRAAPGEEPMPITPSPIRETVFQDSPPTGVRHTYTLKAVDMAGHASQHSESIEETAR
jgi:hypothetical protein